MYPQTTNLLYRLQNGGLGDLHPKIFWILIGTNDLSLDFCSVDAITAGNIAIVQELQKLRPEAIIVINSLLPRTPTFWKFLKPINDRLACYASRTSNVEFFNATDLFMSPDQDLHFMPDNLHPDGKEGSASWASDIATKVVELEGKNP